MAMKTVNPDDVDIIADAAEYAKASGMPDNPDHVANLTSLLENMVTKRRALAQDAIAYPIAYAGRSIDIAKIQPVIEALERALADERRRAQ